MKVAKIGSTRVFSRLVADFFAERLRWPLWLPVALGCGIAAYFALPAEPGAMAALSAFVGGLAAIAAGRRRPSLRLLLFPLAAGLIGFAVAKARIESLSAPVLPRKIGPVRMIAKVIEAEPRGRVVRLLLAPEPIRRLEATPKRVRISARVGESVPAPGSFVRLTAVLMPPPPPAAPGGYDFARWAYFQRIGAVGYAYGRPRAVAPPRPLDVWERLGAGIETMRMRMTARIRGVLPGQDGAIAAALITGMRAEVSRADEAAYRDSGLYHVLSISGLHLALAGGLFFFAVRAVLALFPVLAQRRPIKKWAALAALAGAGFYLVVSGCEIPALRSFLMLATMFFAVLVDRPALSMRAVALAATIILILMPESLLDAGCQMSFASVTGLIALAEWAQARQGERRRGVLAKLLRYGTGIAAASSIAGLASGPIAIFHFGRAAHYGLVANLAAEPVVGLVVMPAATAAMVSMPFGLEEWPLRAMGWGVAMMSAIARVVAGLPGAGGLVPAWSLGDLATVMLGFLWIALWRRRWRWLGLAPVLAGMAAAVFVRPPDVLVGRDMKAVAVRGRDGRWHFPVPPKDKYAAAEWLRRDGDSRHWQDAIGGDGVRCDGYGCIVRARGGKLVALDARPEALAEDCQRADLVVSMVPVRSMCDGGVSIDRFDVWRHGGHAVWLDDPIRIETTARRRGDRPWSRPPVSGRINTGG